MTQLLCAAAALILGCALQISNGHFQPVALALATCAGALAVWAALRGRGEAGPAASHSAARGARLRLATWCLLGFGAAFGLACNLFTTPGDSLDPRRLPGIAWLSALALVVLSAYLCSHLRASLVRARFGALVLLFAVLALAVVSASPQPWIDVWVFQQRGAEALLRGLNPYSIDYPNIYANTPFNFYAPQLLRAGRVTVFPYPPLTAILDVAGRICGDVRLVSVAALVVGAAAIARLGGVARAGALARAPTGALASGPVGGAITASGEGRTTAELAALFVLFQPRTLFVVEQAWTEPTVLAAWAVALLAAAHWLRAGRTSGRAGQTLGRAAALAGLAIGLFAASKQYTPLLLIPLVLALPRRGLARAAAIAIALVLATFLPFAIWNAEGLWRDVVLMQLQQPLRADSLSLIALWMRLGPAGPALAAIGFAAAAALLAFALPRRPSLGQAALAAAAAWLVFVLFNKQAFCNYEWLAASLLAVACAARASDSSDLLKSDSAAPLSSDSAALQMRPE